MRGIISTVPKAASARSPTTRLQRALRSDRQVACATRGSPDGYGWPTSHRNGRLQLGITGRHQIGTPGRLPLEYAPLWDYRHKPPAKGAYGVNTWCIFSP